MKPTTIYKYPFSQWPETLNLPKGAVFLSVQTQHGNPVAWFEVDPTAELEQRLFAIIATGDMMHLPSEKRKYLGTFQLNEGRLVFHVFEVNQ